MSEGLNGILVVDKPAGFTSHDVVAKMRGICGTRKLGHGGTLDPMATGVLPVFAGAAAKAVDLVPNQDKAYEAGVLFGTATDTGDVTGAVLQQVECLISAQQVRRVLPRFLGRQTQVPPMYSAVKIDGRPLYSYARQGEKVARKERSITIYDLALLEEMPRGVHLPEEVLPMAQKLMWLRVDCGKGTYVRTLAEDIGKALGCPATLGALRRTRSGAFTLAEAATLAEIQCAKDENRLPSLLRDVGALFCDMPRLDVDEKGTRRLLNGAAVYRVQAQPGPHRLFAPDGAFLGLGEVDADKTLCAKKLFVQRQQA